MSKNLMPENLFNEKAISWARHQIAVTKRKEEEFRSSSNYGMLDTLQPVVDFSTFYADNESIVDEVRYCSAPLDTVFASPAYDGISYITLYY